jgi:hypothetical protein
MEFNYNDPVKNYQARYFKNLGYSDEDILGILGDLPSADTGGGGVTPELVDQLGRGGDDNNPYNITASSPGVRSQANYNRDPYQSMMYEEAFGKNLGDPEFNRATGALNADGLLSYAGDKQLTGIPGAIQGYLKNSFVAKGLDTLGNMLPVNRRAILENELLGAGVMLDDIGRVVSNDYNSAEGIMAGYNANQIDAGTFDKRRDTIANTLATKYGMSPAEIEAAIAGEYEGDVETDLIDRLGYLNTAQTNIFNPKNIIANQMVQQKEAARAEAAQAAERQAQMAREQSTADRARAANASVYASADRQGFTNSGGGFSTSAADRAGTSAGSGQGFSNKSGRGRTGF